MTRVEDSVVRRSWGSYSQFVAVQFQLAKSGRCEGNIVIPAALPASQKSGWQKGSWAELLKPLFVWDLQEQATQCGTMCQMGGPEQEHQETIKFGGLSTSKGVRGGGLERLWFTLKLRRRNEKLLFTFQTDLSLYFHPHPNKSKGEELWKMRLSNGRGNVNQSSDPLWFTSQNCRSDSLTFATQCIHNIT